MKRKASAKPRHLKLTADQLAKIAEYGGLQFALDEIAIMIDVDPMRLMATPSADRLWWKSRLKEQALQRKAILDAAREGDPQAQKLALEWAKVST